MRTGHVGVKSVDGGTKSSLEMYLIHLHGSETTASASFTYPRIYHSFLVSTIDVQLPLG